MSSNTPLWYIVIAQAEYEMHQNTVLFPLVHRHIEHAVGLYEGVYALLSCCCFFWLRLLMGSICKGCGANPKP